MKTELPLDDSKIDSEKLILPSPGKNTTKSKPSLKMTRKQSYEGGGTNIIKRLTTSGNIDLLPDGRLFNNKSGIGIPVQDFLKIISQWNRKITEEDLLFFKSIIHLLNPSEIRNKSIKVLLEDETPKSAKKRWFKVSPY